MVLDLVWLWYLLVVAATAAVFGWDAPQGHVPAYVALHLALAVLVLGMRRALAGRSPFVQRAYRGAFTLLALPVVFSALGMVLPAVHPEPYEWTWIAIDRAVLGVDPTVAMQAWLTPWRAEVLQWVYSSFYLLPVITVAVIGWRRGGGAFDHALLTVATCFLVSYLGYWLWPTLPPYRFLPHAEAPAGAWIGAWLHGALDAAELHRWDCFPSGHTMLSVVSVVLAWRWARAWFAVLLPIVVLLVISTIALRYHYVADVAAGLLAVPPGLLLVRVLESGAAITAAGRCDPAALPRSSRAARSPSTGSS
jgi:membrane-associated phospholipid phosphatase